MVSTVTTAVTVLWTGQSGVRTEAGTCRSSKLSVDKRGVEHKATCIVKTIYVIKTQLNTDLNSHKNKKKFCLSDTVIRYYEKQFRKLKEKHKKYQQNKKFVP